MASAVEPTGALHVGGGPTRDGRRTPARARSASLSSAWLRRVALCVLIGASGTLAHAQGPGPTLAQLSHRAWTIRDGAPGGVVALAQASDGFLWLGTQMGLYRFDGVRFERFEPPSGQTMPSLSVSTLLALPDSSLWIGYGAGGASVLTGGRLTNFDAPDGLPPGTLTAFARDSLGGFWAATTRGLVRRIGDRWRRVGPEDGYPGGTTAALMVDRRGTLWAAGLSGVFELPKGAHRFRWRAPSLDAPPGGGGELREAPDGSVWAASMTHGLVRLSDSAGGAPPPRGVRRRLDRLIFSLHVDRRASAWLIGDQDGIAVLPLSSVRSGAGAADPAALQTLSRGQGLSGSAVRAILEDREGNVWLGTDLGLDRFRATKFTPLELPPLLFGVALAPADGGGVWAGSLLAGMPPNVHRVVAQPGLPGDIVCAYRDLEGGVWLGGPSGLWYGRTGAFIRVPLPVEATKADVQAIAAHANGDLWLSVRNATWRGVLRRRAGRWTRFGHARLAAAQYAYVVVSDSAGRTWLGYDGDRVGRVVGDSVHVFSAADGLRIGAVRALHVRGDRVWVGGESGVMVLASAARGARFAPFGTVGEPLRGVSGIVETANGDLWVNGVDGVTHLPAAEVLHAIRDTAYRARHERFDFRDGVAGPAPQVRPLPSAVEGTDGRLWFTSETGVAWVDPKHIPRNRLVPPVRIRALAAGGMPHAPVEGRVTLPKRTTAFNIAYTALSLAVPERVQFRYRLLRDGTDADTAWQDAGTRREAIYTNLGPGRYRFQVRAANDDGVWNTRGATLDVVLPPTFVQTQAFLILCAVVATGGVWLLAQWRHRRTAAAIHARFATTLAERARIARELHDTLLNEVTGMAMRLDAAAGATASADAPSTGTEARVLAELRDQAYATLASARRTVTDLRAQTNGTPAFSSLVDDAVRRVFVDTDIDARVAHEGIAQTFPAAREEEVLRILVEALTNVRRHANCQVVRVRCVHGPRELQIRVSDDGRGFVPSTAPASGHWGLVGMRERASAIGAQFSIRSAPGQGTEILLVVRRD